MNRCALDHHLPMHLLDHGHGHGHGHTHEAMDHPGHFHERESLHADRDFRRRAFTVGVGGPVGSGKTALMLQLCLALRDRVSLAAVTILVRSTRRKPTCSAQRRVSCRTATTSPDAAPAFTCA